VLCPSRADRERNPHRSGTGWIGRTLQAILENPRYTGRQVWNRQSSDGYGPDGRSGGRGSGMVRRHDMGEWDVSERLAHTPLVDDSVFIAVQRIRAARATKDGRIRRYALAGLVVCGVCGRLMDAHWVHGRAGYRCRHGRTTAAPHSEHPVRNLYVREDHLLQALLELLRRYEHDPSQSHAVVEYLDEHDLDVVCAEGDLGLRSKPPRASISVVPESEQLTLPVNLDSLAEERGRCGSGAVGGVVSGGLSRSTMENPSRG
jgi:hypothetical protein